MASSEPVETPGPEFHRKLRQSLDTVCRDVNQIVHDVRKDKQGLTNYIDVILRVEQSTAGCEEALDDAKTLIQSMEQQITALHEEMLQLEGREQLLTQERGDDDDDDNDDDAAADDDDDDDDDDYDDDKDDNYDEDKIIQ
nr:hypothetical protein BaRGS_029312 [Batillaria attramentaria]